jgi:hypothetical protein
VKGESGMGYAYISGNMRKFLLAKLENEGWSSVAIRLIVESAMFKALPEE